MPPRWFARQGRPTDVVNWRPVAVLLCCALGACRAGWAQPLDEGGSSWQVRLRVFCDSGGEPVQWSGVAEVSEGELRDARARGGEPDAGVLAQVSRGRVQIQPMLLRRIAAFDVTAVGSRDASLKISLTAGDAQPVVAEMRLADLAQQPQQVALGEKGLLQVFRAADDRLRVRTEREQLIFSPGESFRFNLRADLPNSEPGTPVDLGVAVLTGRSGPELPGGQVQRAAFSLDGPATADFDLTLPEKEGVYTLRIVARRPAGLMRGWTGGAGKSLAERSVQVVVLDPSQATQLSEQESLVVNIDPTSNHWWSRIPEWKWIRRVPWMRTGPLGSSKAEVVAGVDGPFVRLAPAASGTQVAWQAYPLPIQWPGEAHILEVEAPDDAEQELALTLFDRDALGRASSLGDSLNAISGRSRGKSGDRRVVRRMFWPKTDSPMLVISNHSLKSAARFGAVRVYSIARQPQPIVELDTDERLLAAGATDSHLASIFHATHAASADKRYVVDDWVTCYEAAWRLADYTQHAGYNGAVVTVASSEGSLYPSAVLGAHTGLDRGLYESGMADLPRKDLLELIFREFDRRGLRVVLNMRLESSLLGVEQSRGAEHRVAIDCLTPHGVRPDHAGPRYNPLNESVRRVLIDAVSEAAARGERHRSFAGVALDLKPDSHVTLPGDLACADLGTIRAFLSESKLAWPEGVPQTPENVQSVLQTAWNKSWRAWRGDRMTALYGAMAQRVAAVSPDARLWLLTGGLLDDRLGRAALRPRLGAPVDVRALYAERGLRGDRLSVLPNVTLVGPHVSALPSSLVQAAFPMKLNDLNRSLSESSKTATRITHAWRRATLLGFKSQSPFGVDSTYTSTNLVNVEIAKECSSAVDALLTDSSTDLIQGGDANALPLDRHAVSARAKVRALPAVEASQSKREQPLAVRVLNNPDVSYLLAANQSAWPVDGVVTVNAAERCEVRQAGPQDALLANLGAGDHALSIQLAPGELQLFRLSSPQVTALGVRIEPSAEARAALAKEVDRLASRDLSARRRFDDCPNLSFEELNQTGAPIAWTALEGAAEVTGASPADGNYALRLEPGQRSARVISNPFAPPATRQLVMTFHVRAERLAPGGSLKILFRGEGDHEAFTTIPADALKQDRVWRQFVFAEQLPLDLPGPMQIEFSAEGLSVSIDKIELDELTFPMNFALPAASARERLELVKIVQSARIALEEGRVDDCEQVLDGFWPRFLSEFTPVVERPVQIAVGKGNAEEEKKEEAPEVSSRWKSYLPGFLRF